MKLLFVRHGQTDFNKNKLPQGQEIDAPLNETGIQQAEVAAASLPGNIDFIVSSPLRRAFQTATILNKKLGATILLNDDIKELRYGALAGHTWPEIEVLTGDHDVHQKDIDIAFDYRAHGGDSAEDLKQRVAKFVTEMKTEYPSKTILVASHGGVIDAMHILYPQAQRIEADNATIHEFDF